jgi:SOS-response transcriptional repressor LexA
VANLSEIIKKLLRNADISEAELARRTSMPTATLNKLKTGVIDDPRLSTLQTIATYFNITIDQLTGNQPLPNEIDGNNSKIIKVPIFQLDELLNDKKTNKLPPPKQNSCIMLEVNENDKTMVDIEEQLFAVKVLGESMHPQFEDKSLLICSVIREVHNRDFVLAYIHSSHTLVFRQVFLDVQMMILKPINPNFPVIQIGINDYILGVVTQVIKQY